MPGASELAAPSAPTRALPPRGLELPVLPPEPLDGVYLVACTTTPPRITTSASIDDENDAAEELASWLRANGAEQPFLVTSAHGRQLGRGITGV
ncbi:MAG TPA: hypothetical protein VK975_07440, partial [Acidimicrobiales bacterium]|nr:hypothetical protein [Acidimicrobiales bacterium]